MTPLLDKAQALIEAREKAAQGECSVFDVDVEGRAIGVKNKWHDIAVCCDAGKPFCYEISESGKEEGFKNASANADFIALAANTACETIQEYQALVRRMMEILDQHDRYNYHEYMGTRFFEETKNILEEARAALPPESHTPTNA
jgi:hypothetical protein